MSKAHTDALASARRIAHGSIGIANDLLTQAQLKVIRALLATRLPGGEDEFWAMVEVELHR